MPTLFTAGHSSMSSAKHYMRAAHTFSSKGPTSHRPPSALDGRQDHAMAYSSAKCGRRIRVDGGHGHEGNYAMRGIKLTIHHLYADMMNLYGDRGNVISIKKRCEWRGIPVEVVGVGLTESIRATGCDLFLFGGGQDREQALLAEDLSGSKGADLRAIVEDGG